VYDDVLRQTWQIVNMSLSQSQDVVQRIRTKHLLHII